MELATKKWHSVKVSFMHMRSIQFLESGVRRKMARCFSWLDTLALVNLPVSQRVPFPSSIGRRISGRLNSWSSWTVTISVGFYARCARAIARNVACRSSLADNGEWQRLFELRIFHKNGCIQARMVMSLLYEEHRSSITWINAGVGSFDTTQKDLASWAGNSKCSGFQGEKRHNSCCIKEGPFFHNEDFTSASIDMPWVGRSAGYCDVLTIAHFSMRIIFWILRTRLAMYVFQQLRSFTI